MPHPAEEIVAVGKLMFQRRLTDIAGGNISLRLDDRIYITPTGAGQKYLWNLQPDQILQAPIATDELLEDPNHSKESISHLLVYRAFPVVKAIIHAHPFHVMPFCAAEIPLRAVINAAKVYGKQFDMINEMPAYSPQQGEEIVAWLRQREDRIEKFAAGVLIPRHGVFIAAHTMLKALDCLERMDTNAFCVLSQKSLL